MSTSADGFANVAGTRLAYAMAGAGPPLVLIHGATLDQRMWDDQWDTFAARHCVIRYDLRGYGGSDLPAEQLQADTYAHHDDLAALLDHLEVERASVIGLSMGGMIALDFALAYPDRTRALVLVDAGPGRFPRSPAFNESIRAVAAALRDGGPDAARAAWLARPFFAPACRDAALAGRLDTIVRDYSWWHWAHRDPRRELEPPALERLAKLHAPTLVIVGALDIADFHVIAERVTQSAPRAERLTLPGIGHLPNMETPAVFNAAVLNFLARRADTDCGMR